MRTRLTERLGIQVPIVLPGMSWISKPPLVAAVAEAGGLGLLATGPLSPQETASSIDRIRELTDRPFGVGITLMMPGAAENARVCIEREVPVVNYQLGRAEWLIKAVHGYGGLAMPTVTSARHARSAEAAGADALLVTGHEAAAHGERVTSLVLLREVRRAVEIPIVAAGGFADGQGIVAGLALGADAVAMGTRFAATQESGLHPNMKKVITEKAAHETLYTDRFDGMWARIMETPTSRRVTSRPMGVFASAWRAVVSARRMGLPVRPVLRAVWAEPDRLRLLAHFGAAMPYVERATLEGDAEAGVQFVGQAQGLVEDVPSVSDLVAALLEQVREAQERLASLR